MGVPKRLTEMQKRFAEFVVFGGTDGPMTQGEAAENEFFFKAISLIRASSATCVS